MFECRKCGQMVFKRNKRKRCPSCKSFQLDFVPSPAEIAAATRKYREQKHIAQQRGRRQLPKIEPRIKVLNAGFDVSPFVTESFGSVSIWNDV